MELQISELIFLILIGFGATFVFRVSGFGLGIFAMLFLPYLFADTNTASTISCLWAFTAATFNTIKYRKNINFKLLIPLICAALLVIPLAVQASAMVPQKLMKQILGIVLIVLSLYFLFLSNKIKFKATTFSGIIAGLLGGVLNGLFATGGPPIVLYLANATDDKTIYFASIQLYFAIINLYTTATRAVNGILTTKMILLAAIGLIGCLIGNAFGTLLFKRINADVFKKIIYIGMIISGFLMII